MKFTNREYADIVYHYGKADGNAREAQRLYREAFPGRRLPHRSLFQSTYARLVEIGSFSRPVGDRSRGVPAHVEDTVLQAVTENPSTSVRKIALEEAIPKSQVHRVLKRHKIHPYHYKRVQALHDDDFQRRLQFCTFMIEKDDNFLKRILWTDESNFNREGVTNLHNLHYYAQANPHVKLQARHQNRFSVNVWAGIIGKH